MSARRKLRVGMVGARGYVGSELVTLLARAPDVEIAWLTSTTEVGRDVRERISAAPAGLRFSSGDDPEARLAEPVDVVVLALPNGAAPAWVAAVDRVRGDAVVVDLSQDHRADPRFAYGLPARRREAIRRARRIANPGCYATAMQIALDPLVPWLHGPAHVFGVSGYSGAGTAPSPRNDQARLRDNLLPYSLVSHAHEREVATELDHPVRFMPHVAPFFRGITVTISGRFASARAAAEVTAALRARYAGEPLVVVSDDAPCVRDVVERHEVFVGGVEVAPDGRAFALVATVDNLLGGAATTALRNVNLATGRSELAGLEGAAG
ncbi:MAG: N-acetyl-gamma-glutamyl-phosphate reductase [Polyangiaceae bacterium]